MGQDATYNRVAIVVPLRRDFLSFFCGTRPACFASVVLVCEVARISISLSN